MRVLRIGDSALPFTVAYDVAGGTATEGTDFKPFRGVLDFTSGEKEKLLTLETLDNGLLDKVEPKSVRVRLSNPSNGVGLGLPTPPYDSPSIDVTLSITDNEFSASNPDLSFRPQIYDSVVAYAVQSDGKILVGGWWFWSVNGVERLGLARLNADGSIDSSSAEI